ncbi:MAG: nucleotidyltransferase family protein [Christensenella sp.]|nr:nucleotidyltransferase family protein [Christensenella sp.]
MKTTGSMKAAGLITVAGQSQRMHAFKPLLPINGTPMIAVTANVFGDAGITDLFVVVGKRGEEIVSALASYNARFLWNDAFAQTEMFDSLQIGLTAIAATGGYDCAFFLPGDMPAVEPSVLRQLMAKLEYGDYDVIFPSTGTRRLHPPLIRANLFEQLIAYSGEDGLRGAFRAIDAKIGYVITQETGCLIDVDTPEDYARVQQHLTNKQTQESEP